ncbi:MAG: D-glycero-beta-D-manno-heptose 1-phosphate adenylyltransferase [bacterium]|nr:D-glycero-beta-D-manno-heptose 1-phosphate adenylyltransferase [bacterium]
MGIQNIEKKIIPRGQAGKIGAEFRTRGKKLVFTNGCFDLMHPGHIDLLIRARSAGDALMVGLNTDTSIRRLKGETRPILDEHSRALMLAALEVVNWVTLFDEDTPFELISAVLPMVLVKGGDYTPDTVVGRDIVERAGGRIVIVPITIHYSTSAILEKFLSEGKSNIGVG